ncbi:MAG TPA: ImmA/IrrE family metallo-endopeptidase [Pyrinomonadaceae bacterium]|jgi:Zn-dependent peptidase ImmA (M78 family)
MKFVLEKLTSYGFNSRVLTEQDFYAICEAEKIEVLEMNVSASFYMNVLGESIIVLNKRLKGLKRTFAMFHELAHHFLHGGKNGTNAFFLGLLDSKNEMESDAIALIAILPVSALSNFDFLDENPRSRYAKKLYKDRQRLYFLYGV